MSCFNNGIVRQIVTSCFAILFVINAIILILGYNTIVQPRHALVHTNLDRLQQCIRDGLMKSNATNANGNHNASSPKLQGVGYFHSKLSAMIASKNYKRLDLLAQPGQTILPTSLYYNVPMVDKVFKVLHWTRWGRSEVTGEGPERFAKCPYSNCEVITNKAMLQQADALLVSLPSISSEFKFPANRTSSQFWIAFTREPPYLASRANLRHFNGAFNVTAMPLTTSEIYFPYGYYFRRAQTAQSLSTDIQHQCYQAKNGRLVC